MRIFLDANIVFSASNLGSNIARLIERAFDGHTAVTSDFALEEARRKVQLKRPAWLAGFVALGSRMEVSPSVLFDLPIELEKKIDRSYVRQFAQDAIYLPQAIRNI